MTDEVELPKTVPTRTATVGGGLVISADGLTVSGPLSTGSLRIPGPITSSTAITLPPILGAKKPKLLDAPSRTPKKILIAFLDDDDEVTWCGKVFPGNLDIHHDRHEPPEMTLSFLLIDADEGE